LQKLSKSYDWQEKSGLFPTNQSCFNSFQKALIGKKKTALQKKTLLVWTCKPGKLACLHVQKKVFFLEGATFFQSIRRKRPALQKTFFGHVNLVHRKMFQFDTLFFRRYFTAQCVRMFLKQEETSLNRFRTHFFHSMTPDEKVKIIRSYLSFLYGRMVESPIWEGMLLCFSVFQMD